MRVYFKCHKIDEDFKSTLLLYDEPTSQMIKISGRKIGDSISFKPFVKKVSVNESFFIYHVRVNRADRVDINSRFNDDEELATVFIKSLKHANLSATYKLKNANAIMSFRKITDDFVTALTPVFPNLDLTLPPSRRYKAREIIKTVLPNIAPPKPRDEIQIVQCKDNTNIESKMAVQDYYRFMGIYQKDSNYIQVEDLNGEILILNSSRFTEPKNFSELT